MAVPTRTIYRIQTYDSSIRSLLKYLFAQTTLLALEFFSVSHTHKQQAQNRQDSARSVS
jgi:hypothetical protein